MKNEITTASHHEQSYNAANDDAVFGGDLCVDNNDGVRAAQIHIMQFLVSFSVDNKHKLVVGVGIHDGE